MKKIFALSVVAVLSVFLSFTSRAEGFTDKYGDYMKEERKVSVTEFLTGERADDEEYGEIDDFFDSLPESLKDADVERDMTAAAEKYDFSYFINIVTDGLNCANRRFLSPSALIIALCVISFVVKVHTGDSPVGRASGVAVKCCASLAAAAGGLIPIGAVSSYLSDLTVVTEASVPACAALLIAGGRVGTATVSVTFISLLCALFEKIYSGVVLPLIASSFALALVESIYPSGSAVRISSFPLSVAKWLSVSVAAISAFVFGVQSHLAASADTVGMKTLKMALGSAIPLVGGSVGDTVSLISAGASSVKSAFGVTLLVLAAILTVSPLASLAVGRLALAAGRALSGATGDDGEPYKSLSSVMNALFAAVASAGAIFMVFTVTFISYGAVI